MIAATLILVIGYIVVAVGMYNIGRYAQIARFRDLASRVPGDVKARAVLERLISQDEELRW